MSTNVKKLGESIHHFSHRHELFLYFRRFNQSSTLPPVCKACGSSVKFNEEYFSCLECVGFKFQMHKWCAQLPQKLKHPFHDQHLLTLLDEPLSRRGDLQSFSIPRCCACGGMCTHFAYKCSENCEFYMDMKCAMLLPTTNLVAKNKKLHHPHPLFVCQRKLLLEGCSSPVAAVFRCGGCSISFDNYKFRDIYEEPDYSTIIYVCLECRALLHEACADLPQEIQHHPLHSHCTATTLTFHHSEGFCICDFCKRRRDRLFFECSVCSIKMDIGCALLTPCTTTTTENKMNNNGHPHPLIHCNIHPISQRSLELCGGCKKRMVESTCYYCYTCKVFLDESCAHNLPPQIQHPFHQDHPLFLTYPSDHQTSSYIFTCKSCRTDVLKFFYKCHSCDFSLDIRCSSPPLYPMLNVPQLHQHPLAYNEFIQSKIWDVLSCIQCNYYISVCDFRLLPPTIKAPWHRHPLTLTRDLAEQYPNFSILYCEVSERGLVRQIVKPCYVCAECDLISHVHCVLSEVMNYLEEKASLVEELVGGTKLLHLFYDDESGATITRTMDMNDGDFDSFLCEIDKEIDHLNAVSVQCIKKCEILEAEIQKKKGELEEEKKELYGQRKECKLVDEKLQQVRSKRNLFVKLRSKHILGLTD